MIGPFFSRTTWQISFGINHYLTYDQPQAKNVRIAGELAEKLPRKLVSYSGGKV